MTGSCSCLPEPANGALASPLFLCEQAAPRLPTTGRQSAVFPALRDRDERLFFRLGETGLAHTDSSHCWVTSTGTLGPLYSITRE
ncbi:hypothetical protein XELAEV_18015767mg [Xenopus laevis]|uniref:Uncharacterized protein n=1 Tax=Xenopus laevis TaxID=8355 RepID=A0A974HWG8_XENLA|nr:hypothetical protein XELAEV_18015767mg [Xenopus laevis]